MHGPSYMANALACAAANASLDLFEREPRCNRLPHYLRFVARAGALPQSVRRQGRACEGAIGVVEMERINNLDALRARFVEQGVFVAPVRQHDLSDAGFHHSGG